MDIDEHLTDVFRAVFNDERIELTDSTTAADINGWDSVTHINLIFAVEEEFGIKLSTEDLGKLESVGDMLRAIRHHLGSE